MFPEITPKWAGALVYGYIRARVWLAERVASLVSRIEGDL